MCIGLLEWIKQKNDGSFVVCILSSFRRYHFRLPHTALAGLNSAYYLGDKVKVEDGRIELFKPSLGILQPDVGTLSVLAEWAGLGVSSHNH